MAKASAAQGNVPPSKPLFARAATARGTWKTADSIRKKSMRVQDLLLQLVPRGNSTGVFQVQQDQFIRPHFPRPLADCQVLHHSACCFHPTCYSKRPKACQWLNYFTGVDSNLLFGPNLSGHSCPKPGRIPNGNWSCQMQDLLIPDGTLLDSDANTYPGKVNNIFSNVPCMTLYLC